MTPAPARLELLLAQTDWLRRLARSLVRDPNDADDLVQDTLVAGMRSGPRCETRMRPWLGRVLRNAAHRLRRSARRRSDRESARTADPTAPSAADAVARATWQREVVDAVLRLPEPYRTAVVLCYLESRSPAAIARATASPAATVRSRIHRGLAMLRADFDRRHGSRAQWCAGLWWFAFPPSGIGVGTATGMSRLAAPKLAAVASVGILVWLGAQGASQDDAPAAAPWTSRGDDAFDAGRVSAASFGSPAPAATGPSRTSIATPQDPIADAAFRVVDEDQRAVAGAHLAVWPSDWLEAEPGSAEDPHTLLTRALAGQLTPRPTPVEPLHVATSEADGGVRFAMPRGAARLTVDSIDGRSSGILAPHDPTVAGERTVVVYRRCRIDGIVLDPFGRPAAGVPVDLAQTGTRTVQGRRINPREPSPTVTGPDGRFQAFVDPDARITAVARGEHLQSEQVPVWMTPGGHAFLTLRAIGTTSLQVDVVDPSGDAVIGARIFARRVPESPVDAASERFFARADERRGSYSIALPGLGEYQIEASGPDLAAHRPVTIGFEPGRSVATLRLGLLDETTLRGTLLTTAGAPLRDVALVASPSPGTAPWPVGTTSASEPGILRAMTDADGSFEIFGVHPEFGYDLSIRTTADALSVQIAADAHAAGGPLRLAVDGEVLDGATLLVELGIPAGASAPPVVGYELWRHTAEVWRRERVDAEARVDGRTVSLGGLQAGAEYALIVRAGDFPASTFGPWTCRRFQDRIDVPLTRAGRAVIRLTDAGGNAIAGADVTIRPAAGPTPAWFAGQERSAHTDANGMAHLTGLAAGPSSIRAGAAGRFTDPVEVTIVADYEVRLDLRLR